MILKNLEISNILSFKRSKVFFGKNNIIVGYNGAGKSNLLRILQLLIQNLSNGFSTCYMKDEYRFDINTCSWIKLGVIIF